MIDHETTACQPGVPPAPQLAITRAQVRLAQQLVGFVVAGMFPAEVFDSVKASTVAVSLAATFLTDLSLEQVQAMGREATCRGSEAVSREPGS